MGPSSIGTGNGFDRGVETYDPVRALCVRAEGAYSTILSCQLAWSLIGERLRSVRF